jgi:hypothetical protein
MNKRHGVFLLLFLQALEPTAAKGRKVITVAPEPDPAGGGTTVALCFTPSSQFTSRVLCAQVLTYPMTGNPRDNKFSLQVKLVCEDLKREAHVVASADEWYVSQRGRPDQPLFMINCNSKLAWPADPALFPVSLASGSDAPPQPPDPQSSAHSGGEDRQTRIETLSSRLSDLEESLKQQKRTVQRLQEEILNLRSAGDHSFEKKLDALRKETLDKLLALEEAQKNSCYRIDDQYKGQDEVMIAVAGGVLRFVKVKPRTSTVAIGLPEARADELLAEAQAQSSREIFPHILLAVPEAVREVKPFFLQDRLIDPQVYSRLTHGKDARRVAYQDVERFIAELNAQCSGRAKFALPTEEQFVAAAQWLYDPVANGLKPCEAAREQDRRFDVTELLGHAWQLTRSLCVPFSGPSRATCPDGTSYIRKGGAASSTNRLECMPEYRSPAPFDVHQKETSFRLALVD